MGQPPATEVSRGAADDGERLPVNGRAGKEGRGVARGRHRAKIWLACAAFYYPFFWLASSVISTVPALARAALPGYRLDGFRLNYFGALASSLPLASDVAHHGAGNQPFSLAANVLAVIVAAALLVWLGKRARILSGLAMAVLADVAFASDARRWMEFRHLSPGSIVSTLVFFAVMVFGLRWMLGGFPAVRSERLAGFLVRFGNLFAAFVDLPALPWAWLSWAYGFELWPYALVLMGPAALAATVASLRPVAPARVPQRMKAWVPAAGAIAVVLLVAGVNVGQEQLATAHVEALRAAMAAYPKIPVNAPYLKIFFQKGISVSAEDWGGYESESARQMLQALRRDGVNAVALVPYGFAPRGRPEIRMNTGAGSWESDEGIEEMSRVAHALGMKVMLKPGIWVGNGGYAGDLEFAASNERAQWFESYGRFLEHYARLATRVHADLFCVGGEFVRLTPYEAEWRKLIARARSLYPGPLVYAANFGDEFERITFWDALDYIGLQDYYPLPDNLGTEEVLRKVEAVQQEYQRPVILTEVGFSSGDASNRQPWEDGHGKPSLELQARCYQVVFKAFYDKPWFEGMYWWKVGTNGFGGPDDTSLTPWGKPAMDVVKHWYSRTGR
jgi:Glycoside Hydrolase Family 113